MKARHSIIIAGCLVVGCNEAPAPVPPVNFDGAIEVQRHNGILTKVEVRFPGNQASITLASRENVDRCIAHLESMLGDLKSAKESFPVDEHPEAAVVPPPVTQPLP